MFQHHQISQWQHLGDIWQQTPGLCFLPVHCGDVIKSWLKSEAVVEATWSLKEDRAADKRPERSQRWRISQRKKEEVVQPTIKRRILLCRMVRDNLDRTVVQSQKQNGAAETQNQSPEEPAEPERTQRPKRVNPESKEPTKSRLDLLFWNKLNLEDEPESWRRVSTRFAHCEEQIVDVIDFWCWFYSSRKVAGKR